MAKPREFEGDFDVFLVQPRLLRNGDKLRIILETDYDEGEHTRAIKMMRRRVHIRMMERIEQPVLPGTDDEGEGGEEGDS
jgi:hypothetical protein